MMDWKHAAAGFAALAVGACNPTNAPAPAREDQQESLLLSCAAFQFASADALAASYGAENIADQVVPGPEGEDYTATVLYPNDPSRRLEIVWQDPATKARPANLSVSGEASVWSGPNAVALGHPLADVETANGRPFQLWGFGWDYGGWVSDWNGGTFAPVQGCSTRVRFESRNTEATGALGDSQFASDSAEVRAADPVVAEFGLSFAAQ